MKLKSKSTTHATNQITNLFTQQGLLTSPDIFVGSQTNSKQADPPAHRNSHRLTAGQESTDDWQRSRATCVLHCAQAHPPLMERGKTILITLWLFASFELHFTNVYCKSFRIACFTNPPQICVYFRLTSVCF